MLWTSKPFFVWKILLLVLPIWSYSQSGDRLSRQSLDSLLLANQLTRGSDDSAYFQLAGSLIDQSFSLSNKSKFQESNTNLDWAEKICHSYAPQDHPLFPKLYYARTYAFSKENNMLRTDSAGTAALELLSHASFSDNEHVASIYYLLAYANDLLQNSSKAMACIQNALDIAEKKYGTRSELYFRYYNGLCNIYKNSGETEKALTGYKQLLVLMDSTLGKRNKNYINCLSNLSNLYLGLDSLDQVEVLRLEALELSEQTFGQYSEDYMISLFNLGTYYKNVRQMAKARSLLTEAKIISDSIKGNKLFRARILNNLGIFSTGEELYSESVKLYQEVLNLIEQTLGKSNSQYAIALSNLASNYVSLGMTQEAEKTYTEALELYYRLNDLGYDFQKCKSGFSVLKFNEGKYGEVIDTLQQVIDYKIQNSRLRELSFLIGDIYLLAYAYLYTDQYEKADSAFRLAEKWMIRKYQQVLSYMSLSEFEDYVSEHQYFIGQLFSCYFYKPQHLENLPELAYDDILLYKSMVLNQYLRQRSLLNSNEGLQAEYEQYRDLNKKLNSWITNKKSRQEQIDSLQTELENLEKSISKELNQSGSALETYSWRHIRDQIGPSDGVIEFVNYESHLDSSGVIGIQQMTGASYCALIITKNTLKPVIVNLCRESELLHVLKQDTANGYGLYDRMDPSDKESGLYRLIWNKLEPHLQGVNRIYFSPAGLLNKINLSAVRMSQDERLMDRYDLIQLISTRKLLESNEREQSSRTALLLGGLDFDAQMTSSDNPQRVSMRSEESDRLEFRQTDAALRGGEWYYLAGSEKEVRSVGNILKDNQFKVRVWSGIEGSEAQFKSFLKEGNAPDVLHFATHGYFFPDERTKSAQGGVSHDPDSIRTTIDLSRQRPEGTANGATPRPEMEFETKETVYKISDNPMLRSGLILAGGNRTWKGEDQFPEDEDGILTAYEVSQLDLRQTGLVVLSACETGLGDIKANEGVFGLQRAFKIAGAGYLIMSLWKVPDQATREFMVQFYNLWQNERKSIPEAFKLTQMRMRDRYESALHWAGFVLIQ